MRVIANEWKQKITPRLQRRLVLVTLGFWLPMFFFLQLADEVYDKKPILLDTQIIMALHRAASSPLTSFMKFITHGGDVIFILIFTILLVGFLFMQKRRSDASAVLASVGGAAFINVVLKIFFQRTRPSLFVAFVNEKSFSFPSGHAMGSSALAFSLVIMSWRTKYRWLAVSLAVAYVLLIGISRVYLGVHYPSDIIAGWCVSAIWVVLVYIALEHPAFVARSVKRLPFAK